MSKRGCVTCDAPVTGKATYCKTEKCAIPYALKRIETLVEKRGECEIWQGAVQVKSNTPVIKLSTSDTQYRVLALRHGDLAKCQGRKFLNRCGEQMCVRLDHWELEIGQPRGGNLIRGHLPIEPLFAYVEQIEPLTPMMRLKQRVLWEAKKQGFITVTSADEYCIDALGVNPTVIWGDLFFEV